jgi:hypothetical protein
MPKLRSLQDGCLVKIDHFPASRPTMGTANNPPSTGRLTVLLFLASLKARMRAKVSIDQLSMSKNRILEI